jgi:hypothetical protein
MFIEKYTVQIKDIHGKRAKKCTIDANTPVDAHNKALNYCNALTQDIVKITDHQSNIVYTLTNGFTDE